MAITVEIDEALQTGDLAIDGVKETRVREYWVKEQNQQWITPTDFLFKATEIIGIPLPRIGDLWDAAPGGLGVSSAQVNTPQGTVPGHYLTCKRIALTQIQPSLMKATALYSDDTDTWLSKRSIEAGVSQGTTIFDLDAVEGVLQSGWNNVNGCYDYGGLISSPHRNAQNPAADALIQGEEGVSTDVPVYVLTLNGLFYDMNAFVLPSASEDVGTINSQDLAPYGFPGRNQWKFLGVTGSEIKKDQGASGAGRDVWRLSWKFQFDPFGHRVFRPLYEHGNIFNLIKIAQGSETINTLPCRSARRNPERDWSRWLPVFI